jgi:hypothetical protein
MTPTTPQCDTAGDAFCSLPKQVLLRLSSYHSARVDSTKALEEVAQGIEDECEDECEGDFEGEGGEGNEDGGGRGGGRGGRVGARVRGCKRTRSSSGALPPSPPNTPAARDGRHPSRQLLNEMSGALKEG